jgi:GTP-binding protein
VSAKFVLSAASASDFPRTGIPEIALAGRSNVGKSTLINALLQQKIARTSAAPGKTREANYYEVDGAFYLVDLPGYGYARGGEQSAEAFETLTRQYFDRRSQPERRLAGVLHLVDARHPELDSDIAAHRWLLGVRTPVAIVATKTDKLTQAERTRNLARLEDEYDTLILPVSALEETGLGDVWKVLRTWINESEV